MPRSRSSPPRWRRPAQPCSGRLTRRPRWPTRQPASPAWKVRTLGTHQIAPQGVCLVCCAGHARADLSRNVLIEAAVCIMHPVPGCLRCLMRGTPGACLTPVSGRAAGELEAFQDVIGEGDQGEMLSRLVSRVASLEMAVAEAEARRREAHNQLIRLRGNVSVL